MADDDDATFYVGALRCKAQASWNVKIGVRQLPKAVQAVVKMRVGVEGPVGARKRPPAQAPVRTSRTPHSLRTQAPGLQVTRRLSEHTLTRSLCDELALRRARFVARSLYGAVSVPRSVEPL